MAQASPSTTHEVTSERAIDAAAMWLIEAPDLQTTFTRDGHIEAWATECPWWCGDFGTGHEASPGGPRRHVSRPILVRAVNSASYADADDEGEHLGTRAGHVRVVLRQGSEGGAHWVDLSGHSGKGEGPKLATGYLPSLNLREVHELILALEFILKVGSEGLSA